MKKYIPVVAVAAILIGNIAISETHKQDQIEQSFEINSELSEHYEIILNEEQRNEEEKKIIREGYKSFLIYIRDEYYQYDTEARHIMMENQ